MKVFIKAIGVLLIFLFTIILGVVLIFYSINQRQKENKSIEKTFLQLLDSTNYYFVGELDCIKYLDRGEGILKLRRIQSNNADSSLYFKGNLISKCYNEKEILHPGPIFFSSSDTIRDELMLGDIIKYNFQRSKKFEVFRKGRCIYQTSPVLNNPKLEKYILDFDSNNCP